MTEVVYRSSVRIVRLRGPLREAYLPARSEAVTFGVHSEIAEHYGVDADEYPPDATTLDYVVAAAGGWLTGTFGSALEARGIDASHGRLATEVSGEIELEGKVLIIKRIHAHYRLAAIGADRDTIARVHSFHVERCPVARSIGHGIEITTSYEIV